VFDKELSLEHYHGRAWSFAVSWAAASLQRLLPEDMWARMSTAFIDPNLPVQDRDEVPVLNGITGETVTTLSFEKALRLHRPRFRELLAERLDIRFGKSLADVAFAEDEASVTAHFADGTSQQGRLLIGADGARSSTREMLLGPEPAALDPIPFATIFVHSSYTREQALYLRGLKHPLSIGTIHPDGIIGAFFVVDAADEQRPETWRFMMYLSSKPDDMAAVKDMTKAEIVAKAKAMAKHMCEPIRSGFEWLPDDLNEAYYVPMKDWDPSLKKHSWDNHGGLVTLVGDAAHTMTYRMATSSP